MTEYVTDKWPDEYRENSNVSTAIDEFNHSAVDLDVTRVSIQAAFDKAKYYKPGSVVWLDNMDFALIFVEKEAAAIRRVIDNGIALRSAHIARAEAQKKHQHFASGADTIT
jgi:hypothetical protein